MMNDADPSGVPPFHPSVVCIGVDAGGSHTEAVKVDTALRVVGRVRGEPGAVSPGAVDRSANAIADTIGRLTGAADDTRLPEALVVGAAGAGREQERATLERALERVRLADRVRVTTDAEIALESAFAERPGILVCAGTGSAAYARDPSGAIHRAGGYGWQMGDEGSGYALGRAALAAIGQHADGRGPATSLFTAVLEAVGRHALDDLIRWANSQSPAAVAAIAITVQETALAGDGVAQTLVGAAGHDLAAHVLALLPRFRGEVTVALSGAILAGGTPVHEALVTRLADIAPAARVIETAVDPALGAAAIAMRLLG